MRWQNRPPDKLLLYEMMMKTKMKLRQLGLGHLLCLVLMYWAFAAVPLSAKESDELQTLRTRVDNYVAKVEAQPDWLVSRLQMYWTTHATDVLINGERFDHPGGSRAPVPTVKFNGSRSTESAYDRPRLEDVVPYDDDSLGRVTYINRVTGKMEKAHPAKTGCNINALNMQILGIARDASRLYKATGDSRYAALALPVLDTYLKGIYYRNVPTDLSHGHMQTLVGMATFEVIHEDALATLTDIYANLGHYITHDRELYEAAMKKWAENIIANGVPHNNWDLFQAIFVADVALVLQSDKAYSDHKGKEYYLNYLQNTSSIRQWSIDRLIAFGYDPATAIWYESPGYSTNMARDLSAFANRLDKQAGVDLFRRFPIIGRAVKATAQYLFPNRMIAGFGDTHPSFLNASACESVLDYASRHKGEMKALEKSFDSLSRAIRPDASAALICRWVSPSFYSPKVSWLVQRSGMDKYHDLMSSLNGSRGNHQHANGISMELYGKGYVLAPDAGIGKYLYSGDDYREYYSQYPAHNTVCVGGVSSYPVMMSQHAFSLVKRWPDTNALFAPGDTVCPVTYAVVAFTDPETQAQQQRTNIVVKTSATGGFYVDIFRSRLPEGQKLMEPEFHDYFYHNLGQRMRLTAVDGTALDLRTTDELAFAGGHLGAYSYLYDKKRTETSKDVKTCFEVELTGKNLDEVKTRTGNHITMTMWMKGEPQRELFTALSPVNMEYERMAAQPYDIGRQPVLTYVARQHGEAWTRPFVAVLEPSSDKEPSEIQHVSFFRPQGADAFTVGIKVQLKSGKTKVIIADDKGNVQVCDE